MPDPEAVEPCDRDLEHPIDTAGFHAERAGMAERKVVAIDKRALKDKRSRRTCIDFELPSNAIGGRRDHGQFVCERQGDPLPRSPVMKLIGGRQVRVLC
jgi:hypothetical protein